MKKMRDQLAGELKSLGHAIERMDKTMNERMEHCETRMTVLERKRNAGGANIGSIPKSVDEWVRAMVSSPAEMTDIAQNEERGDPDEHDACDERQPHHCSDGVTNGEPAMTEEEVNKMLQEADKIDIEAHPGAPVEPGHPTMPANHTTLAGLLLKWPTIAELVGPILDQEKITHAEEFPIYQEQQRGLLRVHGEGEGPGLDLEIRSSAKELHFDTIMTDVNEEFSGAPTPPPGESWGQVGTLNCHADFDPHKVQRYVQSFKDNILSMHPILIPKELDALVALFLKSLPPKPDSKPMRESSSGVKFAVPTSVGTHVPAAEMGTKRKLSSEADDRLPVPLLKPNLPFRSIQSAMVLSVLALGKICLHRDKIPDVVPEKDRPVQQNSPAVRSGMQALPLQCSPPGMMPQPLVSGLPSPKEYEKDLSQRSPLCGSGPYRKAYSMKRNVDEIPGLDYFALATDIIGSHIGGATLKHVYTWLFMGLYYGQLGRVMESWSCISNGCRTLAVCLRPYVFLCPTFSDSKG